MDLFPQRKWYNIKWNQSLIKLQKKKKKKIKGLKGNFGTSPSMMFVETIKTKLIET